ncbi:nucleoside deaminase [Xanthovirga aplysinae]|uniref:nucleoside deaminase n=1 Tax=Xanthovirga aplysinae TaxID=2529853 RepID=UPI0012BCCE34|nr:nucleoside deaminase [Xanthovirga aplysinae]MTI33539.1 nucleoside deaminase [Xanthovirga aplysinae]
MKTNQFMEKAIRLSLENMRKGLGGPFGAVIVKDNKIIAEGYNQVTANNDPTAHAEIVAIRKACSILGTFVLKGCEIYSSCEPCPMCLGAIYWAKPDKVYFGGTRQDAHLAGFDDSAIYRELTKSLSERKIPMIQIMRDEALMAFHEWVEKKDKLKY